MWPRITAESAAAFIKWTQEAASRGSAAAGLWQVGGALKSSGASSSREFFQAAVNQRLAAAGPALLTLGCRWETNLLTERLSCPRLPPLLDAPPSVSLPLAAMRHWWRRPRVSVAGPPPAGDARRGGCKEERWAQEEEYRQDPDVEWLSARLELRETRKEVIKQ